MVIKIEPFDNKRINYDVQNMSDYFSFNNTADIFFIRGESLVFITSSAEELHPPQKAFGTSTIVAEILKTLEKRHNSVEIGGAGQVVSSLRDLHFSYEGGAKYALLVRTRIRDSDEKNTFR